MKKLVLIAITSLLTISVFAQNNVENQKDDQQLTLTLKEVKKLIDENPEAKVQLWCLEACNDDYSRCLEYGGWNCASTAAACKESCW